MELIIKSYAVAKENGGFERFVIYKDDNGMYCGLNYKELDENGNCKRALRGHDVNIARSLNECLERVQRSVRLAEIMETHGVTNEYEADQLLRFGEVRVTFAEFMAAFERGDAETIRKAM